MGILNPLYPAKINSPSTILTSALSINATTLQLQSVLILPEAPNLLTIGWDTDYPEVVRYLLSPVGNVLTVQRAFQGEARVWNSGTKVARTFTAYDYDQLRLIAHDHPIKSGDIERVGNYISSVDVGDLSFTVSRENNKISYIDTDTSRISFVRENGKIVGWNVT